MNKQRVLSTLVLLAATGAAQADINIGVSVSATGPAASLGIPEKNTFAILPTSIGGEKINYIVLDDATDPGQATKNARKLVTEDKVDVLVGSSSTPACAAIAEVANETQTPQVAMCPVDLPAAKNAWVFRAPQHNSLMAKALVGHMRETGVKTLGFIGFNDPYGEDWLKQITAATEAAGIKLTVVERYNRTVRHEWLDQYIIKTIEEAQDFATQWLWTYNNDRPNMGIGGITPAQKLKMAA